MKSLFLSLALVLFMSTYVFAVDYTYSTDAKEEWALQQEATEQGKTKAQLMQDILDVVRRTLEGMYLDHEKKVIENASPTDRTNLGLPN